MEKSYKTQWGNNRIKENHADWGNISQARQQIHSECQCGVEYW